MTLNDSPCQNNATNDQIVPFLSDSTSHDDSTLHHEGLERKLDAVCMNVEVQL